MKLLAYLKDQKLTPTAFAERLRALGLSDCSESAVRKWAYSDRIPRPNAMSLIQVATEGHVTPADFFDTPSSNGATTGAAAQ